MLWGNPKADVTTTQRVLFFSLARYKSVFKSHIFALSECGDNTAKKVMSAPVIYTMAIDYWYELMDYKFP